MATEARSYPRFRPLLPVLTALLLATGFGCGLSEETAPAREDAFPLPEGVLDVEVAGRHGGILHYPMGGEPGTFNAAMVRDTRGRLGTYMITGTILEFDRRNQTIMPGIASRWTLSPDARRVELQLREGVRFSDGEEVTNEDVLFTFEKLFEEGSKNVLRDTLEMGGQPLRARLTEGGGLEVVFPQPYAAAEYMLTTIPVLPKHKLSDPGKKLEDYWNMETPPQEIVGLGPFVIDQHHPAEKTVYRYNPHYWKRDSRGNRLPYLDELVLHYIEDRNNQVLRLRAGEVDLIDSELRPEDYRQLEEEGGFQLYNAGASGRLTFFWFNLNSGKAPDSGRPYVSPEKKEWFGNLSFRRAASLAMSRESIVRNVYLGQATVAKSLVPPSIPDWHPADAAPPDHDPEEARRLLQEAGFRWKQQGPGEALFDSKGRRVSFSLITSAQDPWGTMAAVLQQDLEKLGMEVSIRQEEFRSVISRIMGSYEYDSALLALEFPFDPVDQVDVLLSSSPMHFWNPRQKEPATAWEKRVDELMLAQATMVDRKERQAMYREVQELLTEHLPLIPLIHQDVLVASKVRVKNLKPAALFPTSLWNIWELWVE